MNGSWVNSVDETVLAAGVEAVPGENTRTFDELPKVSVGGRGSALSLAAQFESIAGLYPNRIAARYGSEEITYDTLNRQANRIAHNLRLQIGSSGENGSPKIVAIYLDRSLAMLSAMLGVVKAGFAYLPIDPTYPAARVQQTLEDAAPLAAVSDARLSQGLPATIRKFEHSDLVAAGDETTSISQATVDSLAYVMYTSGSTGKPKGVLVTHGNVLRLMSATEPWFHFDENDVWTMFHSFAFDFSVWEIWGPLLTGGSLVIVPFEVSRSSEEFYALLSEQRVTVLNQTPSAFSLIDQVEEAGPALPLSLRYVIFGGEALQYRALRNWFKRHGDNQPKLINMYGITETTVHVTYRVVSEADAHSEVESPIGEPIPDLQLYVLDADLKPVAEGVEGELCVGGAGVARGYLNRPDLTAARFVPDPFGGPEARLYRSGDVARRRSDGQLIYLGRNDNQVKINGFRIELGEVEAALAEFPGIRQVSVIAHADHTGRQRLAAYFVSADGKSIAAHAIREFLTQRSPAQMIPAFYIQMDSIPLTHNGKVDRKALPVPSAGSSSPAEKAETPMQERVAAVWREVLAASNIGMDDNFFDIGGSSILLIRVRAELQKLLGIAIPITWMFEFTSIRALADKLRGDDETAAAVPAGDSALAAARDKARKQREAFARLRSAQPARPKGGQA